MADLVTPSLATRRAARIRCAGGLHGFLLDTTVDPGYQRRGIGSALLREAALAAHERGLVWLHVDFEPALEAFYRTAGFAPTAAGLLRL